MRVTHHELHDVLTRALTTAGRYPGARTLDTRRHNLAEGIPVDPSVWQLVQTYV
jgi:LDH2 family malate/lactate/ureidoglycolate dehydrogenase